VEWMNGWMSFGRDGSGEDSEMKKKKEQDP